MTAIYSFFMILLLYQSVADANNNCSSLFLKSLNQTSIVKIQSRPELEWYESFRILGVKPTKDIDTFSPQQGIFVTKRDRSGRPLEAIIRVLSDNPANKIEVIGDFNDWGKNEVIILKADTDPSYFVGTIPNISHADQYRLVVNGQLLLDPSSLVYSTPEFTEKTYGRRSDFLNSVFWDIEGEGKYKQTKAIVDLREKPMAITETEMEVLVSGWRGGPKSPQDTYNFIADSGVIDALKSRGINAIEFLPFNAAADGKAWPFRYQVFGVFAIESKYGTPAEFARMVDKFNESGIAVIMDVLLSHYPFDANTGVRNLRNIGLHNWKKADGRPLFGDHLTEWQTYRYDYENPYVRRHLIDSVLSAIKYFRIGGIRIDNFDGIRFLPGGTEFLIELAAEIRAYAPEIWINAEMFFPENKVTKRLDEGGYGINSYNNGNFFWKIIRTMAQKRTEEIDMMIIKDVLRNDWQWKESMRLFYATNHDEAANKLEGATGAYFATLVNGGGWNYVEGKTRVFSTLAMMAGSYYLDMPQLRLMQQGSFHQNSAIEWDLLNLKSRRFMDQFFSDLSNFFIGEPAFAPHNLHPDIENHIDSYNKVISLERIDFQSGKRVYILINLGDRGLNDYVFGIGESGNYEIAIDSNRARYGGSDILAQRTPDSKIPSGGSVHGMSSSLNVPYLAPYGVVVFQQMSH